MFGDRPVVIGPVIIRLNGFDTSQITSNRMRSKVLLHLCVIVPGARGGEAMFNPVVGDIGEEL